MLNVPQGNRRHSCCFFPVSLVSSPSNEGSSPRKNRFLLQTIMLIRYLVVQACTSKLHSSTEHRTYVTMFRFAVRWPRTLVFLSFGPRARFLPYSRRGRSEQAFGMHLACKFRRNSIARGRERERERVFGSCSRRGCTVQCSISIEPMFYRELSVAVHRCIDVTCSPTVQPGIRAEGHAVPGH